MAPLDREVPAGLCLPVGFSSFIFPLSGAWRGRRTVRAAELSCGGITFFCQEVLSPREVLEVVIPIPFHPLVVSCAVLRSRDAAPDGALYTLKFTGLCDGEDQLMQAFLYGEQLRAQADKLRQQ